MMQQTTFDRIYKQKLLDTFEYLVDFLNKNNLQWWAAYGTIIGAVRHGGIIPWDDDIDIYMPVNDYYKLISLHNDFSQESDGKYEVQHISICPDYGSGFAKVMDMGTTIQTKRFIPYVKGVFVDIFPIYSSNDEINTILTCKKNVNEAWANYFAYCRHYSLSDILKVGFSARFLVKVVNTNLRVSARSKRKALMKALMCDSKIRSNNFNDCRYCFSMFGQNTFKDIYKTSWFNGYKEVPFEGLTIRIPVGYHDLLTQIYGDYMTPPPENERVSRHQAYYVNLKERLTLKEIAERVKSGESLVY